MVKRWKDAAEKAGVSLSKFIIENVENEINSSNDFISKIFSKNSNVLDIGALPPLLIAILHSYGFTNLSVLDPNVDVFKRYFEFKNIPYYKADLFSCVDSYLLSKFDLVCLNEVIEHLAGNLLSALEIAFSYIRPGGYCFITTPNLRSISGFIALIFYNSVFFQLRRVFIKITIKIF